MVQRIVVGFFVVIALLLSAITPYCVSYAQASESSVQDVLVVLDNSGSMYRDIYPEEQNDPDGWRFIAASVVVNYLAVARDPAVTYRIGIISYATQAVSVASLSELNELNRVELTERLDPEEQDRGGVGGNDTNADLALRQALQELESNPNPNPARPPVVMILTDGDFKDNTGRRPVDEYIEEVEAAILELAQQGAIVHAILLGEKAGQWQDEWERLTTLTGGQSLLVDEAEELPGAYIQLVRTVVGTIPVTFQSLTTTSGADDIRRIPFSLDENEKLYVDSLIITVLQSQPDISVAFVRPDGEVVVPIPGEVERRGSKYVAVWLIAGIDLTGGEWQVLLKGGSKDGAVQIAVDYIPLRATLLISSDIVARDEAVEFEALLINRDGLLIDATEALEIQMNMYDGSGLPLSSERMSLAREGGSVRYRLEHIFGEGGVYSIQLLPQLSLKSGETRFLRLPEGERWIVTVAEQPTIREIGVEPIGAAESGQPIRVWAAIEHVEAQLDLAVSARMREKDSGRTLWEQELIRAPGGTFETEPFSLPWPGVYDLTISLRGKTQLEERENEFRYGPDTPYPIEKTIEYAVSAPTDVRLEEIEIGLGGEASPGEPVLIRAQVLFPAGGVVSKAEAVLEDREPTDLNDDGERPDERAGDGIFSGELVAPLDSGDYRVKMMVQGESAYGIALSDQEMVILHVVSENLLIGGAEAGSGGRAIRGEEAAIRVQIIAPAGASISEVMAEMDDGEAIPLHDNGVLPDEQAGDYLFTGILSVPSEIGSHNIRVSVSGENAYGVPLSADTELGFEVLRSRWERIRPWVLGGICLLLGLSILGVFTYKQRQRAPLTGTLRITHPIDQRGRQYSLDSLYLKEATLGVEAGHIPLPARDESIPAGVKAKLKGKWEKDFGRRKIAVYAQSKGQGGVLVGGRPLEREETRLLDGTSIEIGGVVLEYRSEAF